MWLTDLADTCRAAGLTVAEVPGWKTRGRGPMTAVESVICHHTAGPGAGNYPSLRIVRDGRVDLPGPLAQLGLARDGTVYVIAAGRANHAGRTFHDWQDNWHAVGIEAEGTGLDAWPSVQMDAYERLCAALCKRYGIPTARVLGHKEVASPLGRKTDPNFDMAAFRKRVATATAPARPIPPAPPQEDDMTPDERAKLLATNAAAGRIEKALVLLFKHLNLGDYWQATK